MDKNRFCNVAYIVSLLLVFFTGVLLRTITYLYNRSLWHDEASLALSIINDVNFFQPLLHNQFAPQFFMYVTKFNTLIIGNSEWVLRLVPFIFGILSVFLFYFLSKEFLEKKISIILANALFAVNYHIIYYCQEFKQYSTDVFFFMLCLFILSKFDIKKMNVWSYLGFGFLIIFSTMFSLPVLFAIAAWLCASIVKYKMLGLRKILTFLPFFVVFLIYYILILTKAKYNVDLYNVYFWDRGYIKFNIPFILNMIRNCYNYCFAPNTYLLILFIISCVGCFYIVKDYKEKFIYLLSVLSFIFMLIASVLKMYPLEGRAGLYFTPLLILFIIIPIDKLKSFWLYVVFFVLLISLSSYNLKYIKSFFKSDIFVYKNAREITKILKDKYEFGDTVVYNIASQSGYEYYTKLLGLDIKDYVILQLPNVDDNEKLNVLNKSLSYLKKGKNYIFYIEYDWRRHPELPIIKKWIEDKNILWKYELNGSYIAKIKL